MRFIILLGSTFTAASCAALLASGCSLDNGGLGELFVNGGGDGGSSVDATFVQTADGSVSGGDDTGGDATTGGGDSGGGGGGDAAQDTSPPVDTGVDSCASNAEICNNGVDDNCDGKIDCADKACGPAAWTCTHQNVPSGWSVVAYATSPSASASCGTGYTSAPGVYEGPFPNPTCSCTCNLTAHGSCESGNFEYALNDIANNCTLGPVSDPAGNGACEPITGAGYSPGMNAKEKITPASYAGGTCSPTASATIPPLSENGHICAESVASGAGCANNGACVPVAAAGYGMCIQHAGAVACPSGFGTSHSVGTGVTDSRACTACNCTGPNGQCTNGSVTLFTDPSCGDGGTATVAANNNCNPVNGSDTYHAYQYTASPSNESCGGSGSSSPTGAVALTGQSTICCQ